MPKFSALITVLLAFLVLPALAAAAPTATQITTPSATAFPTADSTSPGALQVAGTTLGGTGNVDLRCYYGGQSQLIASNIAVVNGAFSTDVPLTHALITSLGKPMPFCRFRAVPTGTAPFAPPDLPSSWEGVDVGLGERDLYSTGIGTVWDYFVGRAQSKAFTDYYSTGSCGLCDTYLFVPGSGQASNAIWWGNFALYAKPTGVTTRTSVQIDGANAYTSSSAYTWGPSHALADNPGFPAMSQTHTVNPTTGDLSMKERSPYVWCAEDRSVFPPTDANCPSFADTGVDYERSIEQTYSGQMVTIVDHWKSVDGKPHDLDAIYEDTEWSQNGSIAGREGRLNFSWTQDGFTKYAPGTLMPLPPTIPAPMYVKTDASTGNGGDNMNPVGAVTFGTKPSEIKVDTIGSAQVGRWMTRYQRTIPADGEITVAVAYTHDFALAPVQAMEQYAEERIGAPAVAIDSPADGSTVDAGSVHVTGTASSPDKELAVKVNGVPTTVAADGHWSADVPLSEGSNQILAMGWNDAGAVTNAIVHVTRPAAPANADTTGAAPAAATAPATATTVAAAKPVRCVVPKLRGKTLKRAKVLLKRAHCRLGKVTRKASAAVKPGRVIKTHVKAGTRHAAGKRIRVTLAKAL